MSAAKILKRDPKAKAAYVANANYAARPNAVAIYGNRERTHLLAISDDIGSHILKGDTLYLNGQPLTVTPLEPIVRIRDLGGNCPVQAEGTINGREFYFRARGQRWTLGIGADPVCSPDWSYEEPYGDERFAAGWMTPEEASAFIAKAAAIFHAAVSQ